MFGFGTLIDILKKHPRKIVFTEGMAFTYSGSIVTAACKQFSPSDFSGKPG